MPPCHSDCPIAIKTPWRKFRAERYCPAAHGAYWKSYDFASDEGKGNLFAFPLGPIFDGNPFNGQAFDHDGGEIIFNLPNGLQAYMLVDGDDIRIDEGPIQVVGDSRKTSGTSVIVNGLSCMACHNRGMRSYSDTIRSSTSVGGAAYLKVERLYPQLNEFQSFLKKDEAKFLSAASKAVAPFFDLQDKDDAAAKLAEPIGAIAILYQGDLDRAAVASELGFEDPDILRVLIKGNRRLRELGLGGLGSEEETFIKRSVWESLRTSLSQFHRVATELEIGTPHREF